MRCTRCQTEANCASFTLHAIPVCGDCIDLVIEEWAIRRWRNGARKQPHFPHAIKRSAQNNLLGGPEAATKALLPSVRAADARLRALLRSMEQRND